MRRRRLLDLAYVAVAALPLLAGLAAYWLIVFVDPYNVRPWGWGQGIHLDGQWVPDRERPLLVDNSLRQPHDLVIFGASTTMAISNGTLQKAYGARSPLNVSFLAPLPTEYGDVLSRIAAAPGLRRVVLMMDFTLMDPTGTRGASGQDYRNLQSTSWSHGGDFSVSAVRSALSLLMGTQHAAFTPEPARGPDFMSGATPITQSAATMRRFRDAIAHHAHDVFAGPARGCDAFPFLSNQLVPFIRQMRERRVAVDIVFPPYPYILYYDWIDNQPRFGILRPGPVFVQFASFKKCVIDAQERFGGALSRVVAADSNDTISGDLGLYLDNAHLLAPGAYRSILTMVAHGDRTITAANFNGYQAELKAKIVAFGNRLAAHK